jgi:hypothetical protein
LSDESPWLPFDKAAKRCGRAGVTPETLADILQSGRVPIRARLSGHIRADPIEYWLSQIGTIELYPALNEIVARFDLLSSDGRRLALQVDPRLRPYAEIFTPDSLPLYLCRSSITFAGVTVHWPKLADELQAAGFEIGLESRGPRRRKTKPLRPAPDTKIHKAISAAYDRAEATHAKPPNLRQIIPSVQARLRKDGYEASGRQIQELARESQHAARRRKRGVTVASEKHQ